MKLIAAFFASVACLVAQGFAPDTLGNYLVNLNVTTATGGATTGQFTSLLTATGRAYSVSTTGIPLIEPSTYSWTKTGPNTGVVSESDGVITVNTSVTFTAQLTGTFRSTSPQVAASRSGTFIFAQIPQPPPVPATGAPAPLLNISTRATLVAGQTLSPGFVVGGGSPRRVLVRAVGPTLAAFGVAEPLPTPTLVVFSGQNQIASNAGWSAGGPPLAAVFSSVGAFALPAGSKDAAVLLTLNPGNYTASIGGGAGEVLAEVYFVD